MTIDLDEIEARAKNDSGSFDWLDPDELIALVGEARRMREALNELREWADVADPDGTQLHVRQVAGCALRHWSCSTWQNEEELACENEHLRGIIAALVVRGGGEVTLTAADFERVPPGAGKRRGAEGYCAAREHATLERTNRHAREWSGPR